MASLRSRLAVRHHRKSRGLLRGAIYKAKGYTHDLTSMERPHYHGHRQRLRERFLKSGLAGFGEHEVVKLLPTLAIPRSDVKPPAKELVSR